MDELASVPPQKPLQPQKRESCRVRGRNLHDTFGFLNGIVAAAPGAGQSLRSTDAENQTCKSLASRSAKALRDA
jgi:hypothetical protein